MSDDSKSFEKKLDRDFLYYLNLTKGLFENIKNDNERQICEVWLNHLIGKTACSISEKSDRNIFLSRLLLQMQNGKLKGIFLDTPPSGKLPCAFTTFTLPSEIDGLKGFEEKGFQIDANIGGGGDFFESSRDGRTYLATRRIPQGMMAFIAVTTNEGDEIWVPQQCPEASAPSDEKDSQSPGGFVKKLAQFVKEPLYLLRKSPEEREKVLEWLDQLLNDCNKWIRGENPHNSDLKALFEIMYQDYKKDPDKAEILKHPRKVKNILLRDIRDRISERRAEVTKRELILDQYEADEFVEEKLPGPSLDNVWLQCAKKPLSHSVKTALESVYPQELVDRFFELLFQERIEIIEKGELEANKKIAELRNESLNEIKNELHKLKKVQEEYKEYYCAYMEIEKKQAEYEKEYKAKCSKSEKPEQQTIDKMRKDIENEIMETKRKYEKERKAHNDLMEKLDRAKACFSRLQDKMSLEAEKMECERRELLTRKHELKNTVCSLKLKQAELKSRLNMMRNECFHSV